MTEREKFIDDGRRLDAMMENARTSADRKRVLHEYIDSCKGVVHDEDKPLRLVDLKPMLCSDGSRH